MATLKNKLPSTQPAVLKLSLGARTHRVSVDLATLTFDGLVDHVKAALADALPAQWSIEYTDDEGDHVTLSHARELDEAVSVMLNSANGGNTIAFRVVPRSTPLSHRIVPLLRKVGQFSASVARVASERTIQLRNSDVVSRGRASLTSSATRTGSLLRSASRGVASGLQHAHSAVSTRIERRRSRSSSASSLSPSSPSFSETGDKHDDAAFSPTPRADVETVDLRASISSSEADAAADASGEHQHETVEAVQDETVEDTQDETVEDTQDETVEDTQDETAYASDADTLASCDEEDREWDLVSAAGISNVGAAMPPVAQNSWTW